MITIITGVPGSGKTLYAITKLVKPMVGTMVPQDVDGVTTLHPRTIYTNINGLTLDHELIDGGDNQGLRDWHTWAKPGSVIVFDEVQKIWKPRANGSVVPDDIGALETHRHMGVDFILLTQGPMLIDRNLHVLCGRHLHVRRIANMAAAIVYEWDLFSRTLNFKNSIDRKPWKFDKGVYKLYHSATLHTKQKRSLPGVMWFLLLGAALLAYVGPDAYRGLTGKPTSAAQAHAATKPKTTTQQPAPGQTPTAPKPEILAAAAVPPKPKLLGCIAMANRCSCFDEGGDLVQMELQACVDETRTLKRVSNVPSPFQSAPLPVATTPATTRSNGSTGWVDTKPQPGSTIADVNAEFRGHRPRL